MENTCWQSAMTLKYGDKDNQSSHVAQNPLVQNTYLLNTHPLIQHIRYTSATPWRIYKSSLLLSSMQTESIDKMILLSLTPACC